MQDLNLFKSRIDGKIPNEFEWPINVTEVCSTFDKVVSVAKGFSEKIGRLTASNTKENGDNQNWKRYRQLWFTVKFNISVPSSKGSFRPA